jgi:hypothetical protein
MKTNSPHRGVEAAPQSNTTMRCHRQPMITACTTRSSEAAASELTGNDACGDERSTVDRARR